MVDRAELFSIADEILAEGRQPSQRAIRDRLARGGSFGDIGPLFVEWATLRGYRPRPRAEDFPPHLRDRLANVAAEIWHDGLRNGMVAAQNERDRLASENAALKLALAEMAALAETPGRPEDRDSRPEKLSVKGGERSEEMPRRRRDTIAFWERVMQEIADLMGDRLFEAKEIFRLLDDGTAREATKWTDKKWCPAFLADKMRGRAKEGKFFDEPTPGFFRSRGVAAQVVSSANVTGASGKTIPKPPTMPLVATPRLQADEKVLPAPPPPSLKRLAAASFVSQDDHDIPENLIFSMSEWAAEEQGVSDNPDQATPAKMAS